MAKTIDYFLALSSPWTYLAGPRLDALVERSGAVVHWRPFDIAKVFATTGVKPVKDRPIQIQKNRLRELARWRDFLGMPLNPEPKYFPVNPVPAGKMVVAAGLEGADAGALANGYLRGVWAEERNIADEDTMIAIADEQGLNGKALLAASKGKDVQNQLEKNTADAMEAHVFGTPTWVVDGELFWGQDRLDFLARALEKDG